jgi:hypothetical protein
VNPIPIESGALDLSLEPGQGIPVGASIFALAVQGDGILIGGDFLSFDSDKAQRLARIRSNGRLDPAFKGTSGPDGAVRALLLDESGHIYLAGRFGIFAQQARAGLARLHPDGQLDEAYVPQLSSGTEIEAISLLPDGRLLAAGTLPSKQRAVVVLLERSGKPAPGLTLDVNFPAATVSAAVVQSTGQIVVGGPILTNGVKRGSGPVLTGVSMSAQGFQVSFPTVIDTTYWLDCSEALGEDWTELGSVTGNGDWQSLSDPRSDGHQRFYRVRVD